MNLHLSKEYRAIGPFWLVALAMPLAPLPFAYDSGEGIMFCVVGYILGCALLGAAIFSQEWNHQTMDLLLVQPVSRTRLWRGKMRILGFALTSMVLAFLPGLFSLPPRCVRIFLQSIRFRLDCVSCIVGNGSRAVLFVAHGQRHSCVCFLDFDSVCLDFSHAILAAEWMD